MPEWKRELEERLARLRLEPARAAEIAEELSQHLAERHAELLAEGTAPEEAERLVTAELREHALLANLGTLRQASLPSALTLGAPRRRFLGDLAQDVRYALRTLRRAPGYTAAAVLTLALGVGANSAIFSLVNATLLRPLPVRDADRLVMIRTENGSAFSYPDYTDVRDQQTAFAGVAAWGGITASLNTEGPPDLVSGLIVTGNFFEVLGVTPVRGRLLSSADDEAPGAHPVAVIGHGLWRRRFGGREDIVGREILLNGHRFTVIGVAPARFTAMQFGGARDLFVPMMMQAVMRPPRAGYSGEMDPDLLRIRTNGWLFFLARLKPGVTVAQAHASLAPVAAVLAQARASQPPRRLAAVLLATADPGVRQQLVSVATLLMSVVGAVLLLACANVANLSLSRATARGREIAVRVAMGASGGRIVRQLLTESLLVAAAGGALGLALSYGTLAALRASPPPPGTLPLPADVGLDLRVLGFTLAVSGVAGVLFGLAPALASARTALVPALKDGAVGAEPRWRRLELRSVLVVGQVAVSLLLLVAAGLFLRSLLQTQRVTPGFAAERLLAASLPINLLRYTSDQGRAFYRRVVEDLGALPGVESAGLARVAVLGGGGRVHSLHIEGRAGSDSQFRSEGSGFNPAATDAVSVNVVDEGYFRTLGIGLRAGRPFAATDGAGAPLVAIVNEAFVRLHFPDGTAGGALHERVSLSGPRGPWLEVVGTVADSKYRTLTERPTPIVFVPLAQNHETGMTLYVRTTGDPAALIGAVRDGVQALEPNLPLPDVRPLMDAIGSSLYLARMGAGLLALFGGLALLLSAIGVYGVMAFAVTRRTREIGIRIALGAERRTVVRLVIRDGMRLVLTGSLLGLAGAAAAARSLEGFLFGVSSLDMVTFAAVPVLLAGVALVACLVPARRAARVDPLIALRSE